MAANKFATMLHKNTNKLTLILVYTVLEWTLILLLLLNSVFSYITIKFAQFFGLSPICFSCARMDHFRYHLCDHHSKEVAQMGLCLNHQKLAEFHDMCENCASSVLGYRKVSKKVLFSKVERIDVIECDEKDMNLKCSCCDKNFEKQFVDDDTCFVSHPLCDNSIDDHNENGLMDDGFGSGYVETTQENEDKKQSEEDEEGETEEIETEVSREFKSFEQNLIQLDKGEDLNSHDLKFFIDYSGIQLFPFELPDSKTGELGVNGQEKDHEVLGSKTKENEEEDHEFGDFQEAQVDSQESYDSADPRTEVSSKFVENLIDFGDEKVDIELETQVPFIKTELLQEGDSNIHLGYLEFEEAQKTHVDSQESDYYFDKKREKSSKFVENLIEFDNEEVIIEQETQTISMDTQEYQESDSHIHLAHEEDNVSIGTEIPALDSCDQIKHEESSTIFDNMDLGTKIDFEEEKAPETPSSLHSLNPLHKKWLTHETKEFGLEESLDGSVISETDGGDPVNTAEKLKSALKAERKALRDLYLELEEERNASMVAANETMFMINRLQEEKSAMQMEALQYQRMMEEQSEYDQEALQLLNELMMKKEKELEIYRKKVLDYESKEDTRFTTGSTKTRTSSISCSHSEDDDGLSSDLYQIPKDENTLDGNREIEGRVQSGLDLQSSLVLFEEERLSILEQLKFLEERLFALSDEEDRHFSKLTMIDDHYEEIDTYGFDGRVCESTTNGFGEKQLLPLFSAISTTGNEDGVTVRNGVMVRNGYENGFHLTNTAVTRFELEKKRIDMEEEVDQLYGRLQALEADREFLKHCIGSMKKGDKGMELLEEILHHLRDLRDVNLRAKNFSDNALL
uniref:myosin-binding protein 3-like n=1 Tax=Erigeron canadensis TaxID=72917 RepID=UPI001CB93A5E|nr:myosin-binding protein 3-like [Erigeron canadensis]